MASQSFTVAECILRKAIPLATPQATMSRSLSFFQVATARPEDLSAEFESAWPDLEDFLFACCAHRIGVSYVATRDDREVLQSEVPAIALRTFFAKLESEQGVSHDEAGL